MSNNKDITKLIKELERQGWRIRMTGKSHRVAYSPDGKTSVAFASGSGVQNRGYQNMISRLKKGGYVP